MSHRLQMLIPEELNQRIAKAARRARVSKAAWMRRLAERELEAIAPGPTTGPDWLDELRSLKAPVADVAILNAEIEASRYYDSSLDGPGGLFEGMYPRPLNMPPLESKS